MEFEGHFETHITVVAEAAQCNALHELAVERGVKFVHILLDRGRVSSQPMLTIPGFGKLSDQRAMAKGFADELSDAGFSVTRIKIEAAPSNRDVPRSDEAASSLPADLHFEHHVKLLLRPDDVSTLMPLVGRLGGRLSRNARRVRDDGRFERFVTQRLYAVGLPASQVSLNRLVTALKSGGYEVLDVEAEYVVFDSNRDLDSGWIDMNEGLE